MNRRQNDKCSKEIALHAKSTLRIILGFIINMIEETYMTT
jgi:hypothetical protein